MDDQFSENQPGFDCGALLDAVDVANKNPKAYGQYPSCWMHKISAAGKMTHHSESVYNIIGTC